MVKKKSSLEINEKELMDFYGYSGPIGKFQLKIRLLKSWILHSIAYSSPHPGVTLSMQKARGIIIGENSIVSVGSVVASDVPDYCIIAGNSVRVVKQIDH